MIPFNTHSFTINITLANLHRPPNSISAGYQSDTLTTTERTSPPLHRHPAADLEQQQRQRCFARIVQQLIHRDVPEHELVKKYLQHKYRQHCKANTIRLAYSTITCFIRFIQQTGPKPLHTVTPQDVAAFIEAEQDRGVQINTVHLRLITLTTFLRYLIAEGILDEKVLAHKIRLRLPDVLPRAIEAEVLRQLLGSITTIRDRALILLLLRTGMRIGELLNTRVQDINVPEQKIMIYEARKTGIGRVVYFSEDARHAVMQWLQKRDVTQPFLFYSKRNPRLTYSAARNIFMKYVRNSGLSDQGYTLHRLRHSFASELLNAGMRLECLQPLLGHTRIEMTRRYARLTDKNRAEEYFRAMAIIEREGINGHY